MIGLLLAAALAALGPRTPPPQLSIPRDTQPRDVSPDPHPRVPESR